MNEPRYVQHVSGQGEKWAIIDGGDGIGEYLHEWCVHAKSECVKNGHHWLPKSEYRLCAPPERWVDVTEQCEWDGGYALFQRKANSLGDKIVNSANGYRIRKVQLADPDEHCDYTKSTPLQWAFLIERRQP